MTKPQILAGDCRSILPTLEPGSVQCCVTSPPYWGLRDYGISGSLWDVDTDCEHEWGDTISVNATNHTDKRRWQHTRNGRDEEQPIEKRVAWLRTEVPQGKFCQKCNGWAGSLGLEPDPQLYIDHMVGVFRAVWRVLRDDGTLWVNMGDSYAAGKSGRTDHGTGDPTSRLGPDRDGLPNGTPIDGVIQRKPPPGLKPKDLCMMPARLAMALQADGWYLRSDIIWAKPNPMPESVTDRPTKAHEYIFLLTKAERYFYDADAIREGAVADNREFFRGDDKYTSGNSFLNNSERSANGKGHVENPSNLRNKRSVWTIATQPYAEAHFATFPEEIPKLCILAGSKPGDTVLDPFAGSGTVGKVALELGRRPILIELNPAYIELAEDRTFVTPGFF
jgi:DNA modification methylase